MNQQERKALEEIRAGLKTARAKLPAHAEYVMGKANHGAGGAMDEAIRALDALLNDEEEREPAD